VTDICVALRAPRRVGELVDSLVLKDPIRQRGAPEQGHRLVPAAWHMCEDVHAADERQTAVDHDDLLVGVRRIVVISASPVGTTPSPGGWRTSCATPAWTVLRPPQLTGKPLTGR